MSAQVKIQNVLLQDSTPIRLITQTKTEGGPWTTQGTETIATGGELQKTVNPTTRFIVQE